MITELFGALSRAIEGSPALALSAALVWGILSIVLSPCHLASIPLIVAFIGRQGRTSTWRAFLTASLFSTGILITIALVGIATALAGRMMGDLGAWGNYVVAAIFLLVGLYLWDVLPTPWSAPGQVHRQQRKGYLAAFILGLVFGIALGPCTFAYMAPILAVTFKLSATQAWYGILLLLMYAIGHCGVIVLAGTATGWVQRYLDWSEKSQAATWLKRICGVLVIAAGLYLIWIAP
jgi:cytochrome c-type biogenesis protein